MGAIYHGAENMAAEISSMRLNRMETLARLRAQTENRLQDARNMRLDTSRRGRESRRIAVSEIFSNCRATMQRFRTERQEMAQELRFDFEALRGRLQELRTDLAKARAVWEDLSKQSRATR